MPPKPEIAAYDYVIALSAQEHQRRYELGYDIGVEPGTVYASELEVAYLAGRGHPGALRVLYEQALEEDAARHRFQSAFEAYKDVYDR